MSAECTQRPVKRRKLEISDEISSSGKLTSADSAARLTPLPPAFLLVCLPALLAHPPNHRLYVPSLVLSLASLRRCLDLPALPPEIECRAWTGLAEIGMKVIGGGLSQSDDHPWANGIEAEVEKALNKGSIIAQKHPSLRAYKHHLTLMQAQLSAWQHKPKFARNQLRNLLASFLPTDPPHAIYSAHLAYISLLATPHPPSAAGLIPVTSSPRPASPQDINAALTVVEELESMARKNEHTHVALLARVLRLRTLVAANMWADVPAALARAEGALGLSYDASASPKARQESNGVGTMQPETMFIAFENAFEAAMAVHVLMMAVVYMTHAGNSTETSPRLSHLHALLDSDVLDKFPQGIVEITLPNSAPLVLEVTHPRILYLLAFLVTATAKRDAVGRKPKRKVFATEGLTSWETELKNEISFTLWAGLGDVEEMEVRLAKIKADLLCELAAVSIMRSEFDSAEQNLAVLIAHTRTYGLFPLFAARIALHHAHLSHALGQTARALECYRVVAYSAEPGSFVQMAARVGEVALGIGLRAGQRQRSCSEDSSDLETDVDSEQEDADEGNREEGMELARACKGMGGTLEALGQVLEACLTPEILKAKQHLKYALALATKAQDNHLRALVLALIAAHYLHTAGEHAAQMLQTCEQLAAGLGAPLMKPSPEALAASVNGSASPVMIGNAPLGLWIGERFLELFKRAGKETRVKKQTMVNAQLAKAVEQLAQRAVHDGT